MTHNAWLVPALPLVASLLTALFGHRLGKMRIGLSLPASAQRFWFHWEFFWDGTS